MNQGDLFGARAEPPPEAVRATYDVDCTPSPVAHQAVEAVTRGWLRPASEDHAGDAPRVLDLAAGTGSWSRAVRRLFPRAHITALEIREDERPFLKHWADEVVIGDVVELVVQALRVRLRDAPDDATRALLQRLGVAPEPAAEGEASVLGSYDLIVGNIPFSLPDERKPRRKDGAMGKSRLRAFEAFVVAMREHLAPRGRLALYVPSAWWQRGEEIARLAQQHQPFRQLNVPLPVSHRGRGQQAATDAYSVFVWSPASAPACFGWHTVDLPVLDAADRRWSIMPGSER
jgi:SAM-dependent methyltransferase